MLLRSIQCQSPAFARVLARPSQIKGCTRCLRSKTQSVSASTTQSAALWVTEQTAGSLCSVNAVSSGLSGESELYLIVYSKPGCHLCDGLKEKVQAVLDKAMFQPSPLSKASLQIRNILDEPEWEKAYGMSIPVMTAIKRGESEEIKIPRAPPKLTAERLHNHIVQALEL